MTTENTDAAVRILTKTIRRLTAQCAEADRLLAISYSSHGDTMAEIERRWAEGGERMASLEADIANMRARMGMAQRRMDAAMDALTADFDADTRLGNALSILRG